MKLDRTTTILAMMGAATAGYFVARALRGSGTRGGREWGSALAEHERHVAGDFSSTRSAGPEAMRDKPREWSRVDQAVDESFPASDPAPAGGSRID